MCNASSLTVCLQLLSGRIADCTDPFEASEEVQGGTSDEQVVVLRNKMAFWEEKARELKEQVSQLRQEKLQLQGVKVHSQFPT